MSFYTFFRSNSKHFTCNLRILFVIRDTQKGVLRECKNMSFGEYLKTPSGKNFDMPRRNSEGRLHIRPRESIYRCPIDIFYKTL